MRDENMYLFALKSLVSVDNDDTARQTDTSSQPRECYLSVIDDMKYRLPSSPIE